MAKIVKDYGLVYNDDGSMCTTKRTDKIPFTGVTSFAVETATTNFLGPYAWEFDSEQALFYPSGLASGKTWADCWDASQRAYVGGQNLTTYRIYTKDIDLGSTQAAGTKITLSWKHKGYLWFLNLQYSLDNVTYTSWASTDTVEIKGDASLYLWEGTGLRLKINGVIPYLGGSPQSLLDRWYDIEITYTLPTDARYIQIVWSFYQADLANGGLGVLGYIRQPQLEIKPFASSFVNGTRPAGKLIVEPENLGFNPGTDDWVVSYRKYPIATQDDTLTNRNYSSFGEPNEGYYFLWGKYNTNQFIINVDYNDGTGVSATSTTFNPDDYFRHWHSEVILKHNGTIEYWVDGVLQCQATLTTELIPNYGAVGLSLGGYIGTIPCNNLITNITYGKYTDQWTTEYIQRISAMTSTFYVPTKRVIV